MECGPVVVECWLCDDDAEGEIGDEYPEEDVWMERANHESLILQVVNDVCT